MTPTTRPPRRGPLCYYSLQVLYLLNLLWEFHELYASPANSGTVFLDFSITIAPFRFLIFKTFQSIVESILTF
jgi:hypothetical protein